MGLFNILFGGSSKPVVTRDEYRMTKNALLSEGLSDHARAKVDEIFAPDFDMPATSSHPRGLEKIEVETRIKWMRKNKSKHGLSDNEINKIEDNLMKRL